MTRYVVDTGREDVYVDAVDQLDAIEKAVALVNYPVMDGIYAEEQE